MDFEGKSHMLKNEIDIMRSTMATRASELEEWPKKCEDIKS